MGSVAAVMDQAIEAVLAWNPARLAFHTGAQAADFCLGGAPRLVGNGFDLSRYHPPRSEQVETALGWAGRISPEKGLEDAARVAARLGWPLRVWGLWGNEALGNVVVEAMTFGVPVATYACGAPGELVREGINGANATPDRGCGPNPGRPRGSRATSRISTRSRPAL